MLNNQNIEKCKTCPSVKDDRYYQGFPFENKQTNKQKQIKAKKKTTTTTTTTATATTTTTITTATIPMTFLYNTQFISIKLYI